MELQIEDLQLKIKQLRSSLVTVSDFEAIQKLETALLAEYIETLETTNRHALDNMKSSRPKVSTPI